MSQQKITRHTQNHREKKLSFECLESRHLLSAAPIGVDTDVPAITANMIIDDGPQVDYSFDATADVAAPQLALPTTGSSGSNLQVCNGGSLSSSTVAKGNSTTVTTGTIINRGPAASTAGTVKFYASTDATINTSDTYLGSVSFASLAKSSSRTVSKSINTSNLSAGTYYIGWIVESSNDSTTTNNTARCTTRLTVTANNNNSDGNDTRATATDLGTISGTKERSSNIASGSDVDWYKFTLSKAGSDSDKVTLSYSHSAGTVDLDICLYDANGGTIRSSGGSSGTETISLSGQAAGTYYVKVYNYKSSSSVNAPYTLRIISNPTSTTTPDIVANNGGSLSATSVTKGNTFSLQTGTIKNNGSASTLSGYNVKVYASTDTTINTSDIYLGEWTTTSALAAGSSITPTITGLSTSSLTAGTSYYIGWIVSGVNGETSTSNNTAYCSSRLTVTANNNNNNNSDGNDTKATATNLGTISGTKERSSNIASGSDVDWYKFTLSGTGSTSDKVTLSYTHSNTVDLDIYLYDANGAQKGKSIATSGTENISLSGLAAGTYYVKIYNCKSSSTTDASYKLTIISNSTPTPTPDIEASNGGRVSTTSVIKGNDITVTTGTIRNIGSADASVNRVSFFASTSYDHYCTTDDIPLEFIYRTIDLAPNASTTVSATLDTSKLVAGKTYYIGWLVSSSGDSRSVNNTAYCTTAITVKSGTPDLQANSGGKLSSTSLNKGGTFNLTTGTIKNIGNTSASSYTISVYASTDSTINRNDILLRTVTYSEFDKIAVGASDTKEINAISTSSLTAGKTYYIGWMITNVNGETVTSNNTGVCSSKLTIKSQTPAKIQATNGGSLSHSTVTKGYRFNLTLGKIKNIGDTKSSSYKVKIYASLDSKITTGDICLGTVSMSSLSAGNTMTLTVNKLSTSKLTAGKTYYIGWIISGVSGGTTISNSTGVCSTRLTVKKASSNNSSTNYGYYYYPGTYGDYTDFTIQFV